MEYFNPLITNQVEGVSTYASISTTTATSKGWRSLDLTPNHSVVTVSQALSPSQIQSSDSNGGPPTVRPQYRTQRSSSVPVQQNQSQIQQSQQQVESVSTSKVRHSLQYYSHVFRIVSKEMCERDNAFLLQRVAIISISFLSLSLSLLFPSFRFMSIFSSYSTYNNSCGFCECVSTSHLVYDMVMLT